MTQPRDVLEMDILFVGAGPATLASAIHLVQLCKKNNVTPPTIGIIEKGSEIGSHQMSGAVLQPSALKELFPDFLERGCPIESEVTEEGVYFLTKNKSLKFPIVPPQLNNHGNYVISLAKFTAWLGQQAMEIGGIDIFTGFAGTEVIYDENNRVLGVITGDKGVDAKGEPKPNFERGVEIRAKCTIFGEGVRGFLSKTLIPKLGLDGRHPQIFETGVKEVWECPKGTIKPGLVIHTMGYPLSSDTVGGTFIYGMKDDLLVIGLVVSLDYKDPFMEPYKELQKLKSHPLVAKMIKGGKQVAYGAKAISAGGYYSMPQLCFDGGMLIGESGHLLDISKLKGVHVGMASGMLAAQVILDNIQNQKDFSKKTLQPYQSRLLQSRVGKDLYKSRNFHQALAKGMPMAFLHLGFQQITGGRGLIDPMPVHHTDRNSYETVEERYGTKDAQPEALAKDEFFVDKLTSVFNAGTIHDEHQVAHLKIGNTNICYDKCNPTWDHPCTRFCPASVYEMLVENEKPKLQVNFTNCVHCQTCDIKCPGDNITWTPPEAGGGPNYKIL
jgi:electron-transferring-flavoprotein dehydrogenase